jgi:H+/Cl- antiporter ClcA
MSEAERAIQRSFFWLWVLVVLLGLLSIAWSCRRMRQDAERRRIADAEMAALLAYEARHDVAFEAPKIAGSSA